MFQEWFKKYEEITKDRCKCCEDIGEIKFGKRIHANDIKRTLQIIDNKNSVLENEIPINYCPMCGRKLGD